MMVFGLLTFIFSIASYRGTTISSISTFYIHTYIHTYYIYKNPPATNYQYCSTCKNVLELLYDGFVRAQLSPQRLVALPPMPLPQLPGRIVDGHARGHRGVQDVIHLRRVATGIVEGEMSYSDHVEEYQKVLQVVPVVAFMQIHRPNAGHHTACKRL